MKNSKVFYNTSIIKNKAREFGFDFCGVSKAEFLEGEASNLEQWLAKNYHGKMAYMANHFDKRLDPRLLVPGAKSVISLVYNYYPSKEVNGKDRFKIAKYAYGDDYHLVIKKKLKSFFEELKVEIGQFEGRVFVDSAPVMERQWAAKSGLGWIGKNSLLLNKNMGSFFFLAEVICDLELTPDGIVKDHCGTCTKCIDACPTEAIVGNSVIDASKCISYLTIELKEEIPSEFTGKMEDWIFGCDICQDVCPWNRFSKPQNEPDFSPSMEWANFSKSEWVEMTEEVFRKVFKKSAINRSKYAGLKRNIHFAIKKGF